MGREERWGEGGEMGEGGGKGEGVEGGEGRGRRGRLGRRARVGAEEGGRKSGGDPLGILSLAPGSPLPVQGAPGQPPLWVSASGSARPLEPQEDYPAPRESLKASLPPDWVSPSVSWDEAAKGLPT